MINLYLGGTGFGGATDVLRLNGWMGGWIDGLMRNRAVVVFR